MTAAHDRHRLLNMLHSWMLAAGSLLLLGVTAWAFGGWSGIVYALIFGGVSLALARRVSPHMVLSMYKARPLARAEFPAGFAIVEELARRAGLPSAPSLHVVPSTMMNAFAVGRRDDAAIAVTDALVRTLSARELAGVLAHEMSHIAHEDVRVMAFADMVSRFTSFMSTVGLFSLVLNLFGFAGGYEAQVPWLAVLVLMAAPTVGGLLQMALSRTREFDADLGAVALTGDPDGLASALTKLEKAQGRLWESLVLPGGRIPDPSVLRTHPLTADRVARLMALKPAGGQAGAAFPAAAPAVRRPSLVPRVRLTPDGHRHGFAGPLGFMDGPPETGGEDDCLDDSRPAQHGPLNAPSGKPRMRLSRGAVWW
ncbi:MAG: zinc metalloprotease HtpX [Rhizobiaceae bacterium]